MNRFIEHFVEPNRLLLYWQAQDSASRSRYYVGQLTRQNGRVTLEYDSQGAEFSEALTLGFQGYPAFDLRQTVHNHQVLEAFMRRLPPRSRQDFGRYLELRGIPKEIQIDDFTLLGYTGAKLPNDGFELVHPFDDAPNQFEFLLEVAGFRHNSKIPVEQVSDGDSVRYIAEPDNEWDPKAVRLEVAGNTLGYVPRGYLSMLHRMWENGARVEGQVFRVNGTARRPLVYVLTRIISGGRASGSNSHYAVAS